MTRVARSLLVLALVLVPASSGLAQSVVPQVTAETATEVMQRQQELAIANGVAVGAIDAREAQRLTRALRRIQEYQERCYSDGVLTVREQVRLERYQQRLQQHIDRALAR